MTRPVRGRARVVVLQQTTTGWKAVRASVPPRAHARSERVPRPPSYRLTAAGAEDGGLAVDERQQVVELLGLVDDVTKRLGKGPTALLALYFLTKKKGKRK